MITPVESREAGGVAPRGMGTGDPGRGGLDAPRVLRPGARPHLSAFPGLGRADRQDLSEWSRRIADSGIDAVLDLSARPWRVAEAAAVIGVFETAKPLATWIVLQLAGEWLLLRPADGFISPPSATLRDVLGRIALPESIPGEREGTA